MLDPSTPLRCRKLQSWIKCWHENILVYHLYDISLLHYLCVAIRPFLLWVRWRSNLCNWCM